MSTQYDQDDQGVSLMAYNQYIRFVRWTPKVTDEEEAQLFERIERGKSEQRTPHPDARMLEDAKQARDRLVEGYQPLVIYIAKSYQRRARCMELLDLVQEGNIGLLTAIADHLPEKGHFTGLASCCIRQAIWLALYESDRFIRVSQKVRVKLSKLAKVERRVALALGREPTYAELAEEMHTTEHEIVALVAWRQQAEVESMQALLIDEDAEDKYDFVNLFEASVRDEAVRCGERDAVVQQAMEEVLSVRQREMLHWRYGFDRETEQVRPYQAVADMLGVSFSLVARYDRQAKERLREVLAPVVGRAQDELSA